MDMYSRKGKHCETRSGTVKGGNEEGMKIGGHKEDMAFHLETETMAGEEDGRTQKSGKESSVFLPS